jgi:uncharacterized protein YqiB (DUF1249 family)
METKGMVHPEGLEFNEHLASGQESEDMPARTNIYERIWDKLEKILGDLTALPEYHKFKAQGFMDLGFDNLGGNRIALSHYYEDSSGDMIPDPDMEILLHPDTRTAEALTYNDSFLYREVYPREGRVNPKAKKDLNDFLDQWLSNILQQGFKPAQGKKEAD